MSTNNSEDLTYEELRTFKGFETVTEKEAKQHLEIIKKLGRILYHLYENDQDNNQTDDEKGS